MKKWLIVSVVGLLLLIALTAATCGSNIGWTAGTPLSPCKGPDFNPGYLGAYEVRWEVTVRGTPAGYTDTSGAWDADTTATPYNGETIQYAGYEYRVTSVNVGSHTMSVAFVQSC
jgi:hypothetical protein